ncbi:MAG TPA: VWA domain-containing protein [Vicinamibacterales bacterium]|nr:VWA domain-containing protein [Vicinamibacterales bacterium]
MASLPQPDGALKLIAAAVMSVTLAAQQAPFATKIEMVRVDVLATDRGRPVRDLTAADFEVSDNGVPQQVELVSFEQIPLNVILALDMSDSVAGERLDHLRAAGRDALALLQNGDQSALVTFSHAVTLSAPLSENAAAARAALDRAEGLGETSMFDGVFAAMMVAESDVGRALMIVFSDGVDTSSYLTSDTVLNAAKRSDVVVYPVSVGRKQDFLNDLASFTGGRVFELAKTSDLASTFRTIVDEFRHRYLVSYTPRGVSRDGWHRLEVKVKKRGVSVKARPGYLAGS